MGSDKVAEEEGEDLEDEEEYDEEEEEDDDDRPRKKPRHGGFILDEAGTNRPLFFCFCFILLILLWTCYIFLFRQTSVAFPADERSFDAGWKLLSLIHLSLSSLSVDVDDEYEDEEDQWEDGAEDILEKGEDL